MKATPREDILRFAVEWAPFGGGDADQIFLTFGLTVDDYFDRVAEAASVDAELAPHVRRRILDICSVRRNRPRPAWARKA